MSGGAGSPAALALGGCHSGFHSSNDVSIVRHAAVDHRKWASWKAQPGPQPPLGEDVMRRVCSLPGSAYSARGVRDKARAYRFLERRSGQSRPDAVRPMLSPKIVLRGIVCDRACASAAAAPCPLPARLAGSAAGQGSRPCSRTWMEVRPLVLCLRRRCARQQQVRERLPRGRASPCNAFSLPRLCEGASVCSCGWPGMERDG